MEKIIKGRKYNTDTATSICTYDNGLPNGDFNYISEELFVKRTGEYFLYCIGGAKTKYAKSDGDMICAGSTIIPISDEQAKKFVENYSTSDVYEEYFGEVNESGVGVTTIRLSEPIYKKLQEVALKDNKTKSQVIADLINQI